MSKKRGKGRPPNLASFVEETPEEVHHGRWSKRQSTQLSSAATRSLLNQSLSPGPVAKSKNGRSPAKKKKEARQAEVTVIPETPDVEVSEARREKTRRKSLAAMQKVLQEDFERDQLELEKEEMAAMEGGGRKEKLKGRKSMMMENISRIASPQSSRFSRGSKVRSGLTLQDFPCINSMADTSLVTLEDIEGSSSSEEEEIDESVGESVKKYLPKPLLGRKSVLISGNLKRGGGKNKKSPKKATKSRKNLNPLMERLSGEGGAKKESSKNAAEEVKEELKEKKVSEVTKVEPRRSSGRAATKAASQTLSPAVLQVALATSAEKVFTASTTSSTPADSGDGDGASAGNTPSYQNFSTESAKEIIAKLQQAGSSGRKRGSSPASIVSPKRRKEGEEGGLADQNTPMKRRGAEEMMMATTPKPAPMRKTAMLKMAEKTSLTPQPMEMCSPSPTRRSGREATKLATKATDSFLSSSSGPPAPATPPLQPPPQPLKGLLICVDYRSEDRAENTSGVLKKLAIHLGADAVDKVKKGVTHLIFSNGHEGNFSQAKKLGIHILSMGWLEEAKNTGLRPDETAYPSFSLQRYNSPHLYPKLKKMRSMQPKTLEEDYAKATKSMAKKLKAEEKRAKAEAEKKRRDEEGRTYVPKDPYYYKGCDDHKKKPHYLDELLAQASPSAQVSGASTPSRSTSAASSDDDFDTPLAQRLLKHRLHHGVKETANSLTSSRTNLRSPSSSTKVDEKQSSNLDTTGKPARPHTPSPSPQRRSARASTQLCSKATEQAVLQDASPPFQELPPSPVLKRNKSRNPLGAPVLESTRVQGSKIKANRGRTRSKPLGKPVVESTRLSFSPKKAPQVSPLVQKIQNDILFDSLLKSPPKQAVTLSSEPLPPPPSTSAPKPLPLPRPSSKPSSSATAVGEVERQVSALTAPGPGASKSLRRPPSNARPATVRPPLNRGTLPTTGSPSKPPNSNPVRTPQQSPSKAQISPGKSPRLVAPWRHQGKAPEPADYEDVYEFSSFPEEPTTSSRPAKPPQGRSKPPLQQSLSRREVPSSSKSQSQSPRRTQESLKPIQEQEESSSTHGSPRRTGTTPTRPFSASSTSPSRLPISASSSSPSRPLTSPTHPLASPPPSLSPSRKEAAVSSPTHRISSPAATNRLGSPSARIGSPRAEHSRLTSTSQRPGSLLLPSSATPGISLTSLASDNIVASVESLNSEEENNRPPPTLSSTSQAAWKSLASTSLVVEQPNKPKKSALLSRIFSKPPTPKAPEASKTAEAENNENEGEPSEESENKQGSTEEQEVKILPKRAHKLLPQRVPAVLDQTVDPQNQDGIDDARTAEVTNVHLTSKSRKREAAETIVSAGEKEKEKAKKGKKRKSVEKKKTEVEVDDARIQKELKKREKASRSRRSSADFVKPKRSQSRQSSTSESSASVSSTNTNLSALSSQRISSSSTTNSQQATTSTKGRKAKVFASSPPTTVMTMESKVTLPNIVCTSCHRDDSAMVKDLVRNVTATTTHVISGEGKRTLNLLKGLMQGCWLLTKEWAYSSLEEGRWSPEEPFEMVNFSPAVRNMREERINAGGVFKSELFRDVGTVYVSGDCRAPKDELRQLILSGGGSVANTARVASVVVGEFRDPGDNQSTDCVTEKWVLDSVQFHVVMPFSDYPL